MTARIASTSPACNTSTEASLEMRYISYPGDFSSIREGLRRAGLLHSGFGLDLEAALMTRFVHSIRYPKSLCTDPRLVGPVLFLATHEVAIETAVAMGMMYSILGRNIATVSKVEHQGSFMRILDQSITDHADPDPNRNRIYYFDRKNPRDLFRITRDIFNPENRSPCWCTVTAPVPCRPDSPWMLWAESSRNLASANGSPSFPCGFMEDCP